MGAAGIIQTGLSGVQLIQTLIQGGFDRVPAGRLLGRRGLERSGRGHVLIIIRLKPIIHSIKIKIVDHNNMFLCNVEIKGGN